jgi:hypothetical protein
MQKKIEVTVISKTGEFIFTRILPHAKATIQHRGIVKYENIYRCKVVTVQSDHLTTTTTTYALYRRQEARINKAYKLTPIGKIVLQH